MRNIYKYVKWFIPLECDEGIIATDKICVIEGRQQCYRCQKEIPVLRFGVLGRYCNVHMQDIKGREGWAIYGNKYDKDLDVFDAYDVKFIPEEMKSFLESKYKFTKSLDYLCPHCKSVNYLNNMEAFDFYTFDKQLYIN